MAKPARRMASPTSVEVAVLEAGEEAVVHLQAVGVERPGHLDPVEDRHGAVAGDLVEVTFGKRGKFRSHGGLRRAQKGMLQEHAGQAHQADQDFHHRPGCQRVPNSQIEVLFEHPEAAVAEVREGDASGADG